MSYYKTKKIVLNQLNKLFENASKKKTEIDINALRLQIMLSQEIGELSINKMIDSLGKYYGFEREGDVIKWV